MEEKRANRIAIVSSEKCKPEKCQLECKKNCPLVKVGKLCIEISYRTKKALISEEMCIGCGICVKKCPFSAVQIINLLKNKCEIVHKYGINSFQLIHLPILKPTNIIGIIGSNGMGKSTALKILAGELKPNLGNTKEAPGWNVVKKFFKGNILQNYFEFLFKNNFKIGIKPQYIDTIIELKCNSFVRDFFCNLNENDNIKIIKNLSLSSLLDRKICELSGGELQRFSIACTLIQSKKIFLFDEISSYLDIKQRIQVVKVIKDFLFANKDIYIAVVEHDLAIVDYLSDFICFFYGVPGAYGIVSSQFSAKEGINIFLSGFIPGENIRFRNYPVRFVEKKELKIHSKKTNRFFYPSMYKNFESFKFMVDSGYYFDSEITVLLGENGTGKTLFIRLLGHMFKSQYKIYNSKKNISYKPQRIFSRFKGKLGKLISKKLHTVLSDSFFKNNIFEPLRENLSLEKEFQNLSGGEIQRLSLLFCLGKISDLYLIDEPSSYLDSEQRLIISKIIKKFFVNFEKPAFVVEHDFIIATYLADKIIVFEGTPSFCCKASSPLPVNEGINKFLKQLDITFRKDPINFFPRINKLNSSKDRKQKSEGSYYFEK
ncbi:RNase L inhibitor (nucleomorph) [Cryptomonas paramecium]|uniref:RNase L inhibitor n=1 Tax=Cryptomonas paramaecium TaxID=2898 RepID=F2HIG3_9CRYP|nr:RNase L inhibitor [Cryptomonas paramecium]AEA39087.1 RNase L inhibitor [Cryptomonas paramecium]|mmetsp:Transcript_37353/g.99447  ORF Transcript_37353/g.99447 Transcript_37353/m.99447 type:complete len:600 (+) Transcript_37353:7121-8920(+)